MKKLTLLLLLMTPLIMTSPLYAVTYPFSGNGPTYPKDGAVRKVETKSSLLQSGTKDVKNVINVNGTIWNPSISQEIGHPMFPDAKRERIRSDKLNPADPSPYKQHFFNC
jgi:hypothetical protein